MTDLLRAAEYIDDRSIEELGQDEFRHEDVVKELAHLVRECGRQANIALFAPWGSGKSGISHLLRGELEDKDKKQRYVYFDAFKHRETSLRRSFLRTVAAELDPDARARVDEEVYGQEVTQTLNRSNRKKLFWLIASGVLGAFVLAGLLTLGLSKLHPGPFNKDFPNLFARTSGVLALVGGLIGVAFTTVINGYSVTKTTTPIAEDDEFEREFRKLVEGADRVVVFIDELDRCAAAEVVATLETMRVFLDVENCIFIVAADRQALEQALRLKARQETPADDVHPYFSSAGAYVDKIFQYQLALPPLRWTDAGEFAENLVKNRDGLWKDLRDWDELQGVLTALIPTHVTSPRRVKVLLNAYVIEHRLAQLRVGSNQMSAIKGRAAALAQLVCLRTEFPLFADELEYHPELPAAARALSNGAESPIQQESPITWSRADEFINGGRPLVPLLYDPPAPRFSESAPSPPPPTGDHHE